LKQPTDRENKDASSRDHQAYLEGYLFRPGHVAGNSNGTNQQPQQLKESGNFVEHELGIPRDYLIAQQFIEVRQKILDIPDPRTKKRLLPKSCRPQNIWTLGPVAERLW
jgi:hypothetical protein